MSESSENETKLIAHTEQIREILMLFERRLTDLERNIMETVKEGFQGVTLSLDRGVGLIAKAPVSIVGVSLVSYLFWYGKINANFWALGCFVFVSPFYMEGLKLLSDFLVKWKHGK